MDPAQEMLFNPVIYIIIIVAHILASCIALGAVAVVDYLHLIGLKNHRLEKKLIVVYPFLTQVINGALTAILITGVLLVINTPDIIYKTLFQLKMAMVVIVSINGVLLQRCIGPHVERLTSHDRPFPEKWLLGASLSGAISVVSWFSIFILALTKKAGYTWDQFLPVYLSGIVFVFVVAQFMERRAHSK